MIFELIFDLFYGILNLLINILPSFSGLSNVIGAISGIHNVLSTIEFFVPISVLFVGIGVIIAIDLFMWGTWIVNWIIHRIPVIG